MTRHPHMHLTEVAAVTLRFKAYNATGEVDLRREPFTLGTRVLLTCDVSGLSEGNEVVSYRWFRNCSGGTNGQCEIRDEDPYYRLVNDTLLVDVTYWDQGGRYYCYVRFNVVPLSGVITPRITVAG